MAGQPAALDVRRLRFFDRLRQLLAQPGGGLLQPVGLFAELSQLS